MSKRFDAVRFSNPGDKFDFQLGKAIDDEEKLAMVFQHQLIELKTETYQWEQTGNICIEYERDGKPSGIKATPAAFWVHELRREGDGTVIYLMFPIEQLRKLCRQAFKAGQHRTGGDGGLSKMVLLRATPASRLKIGIIP